MAKGIVITPDNLISEQEFPEPVYDTVGKVVGGWVEVVRPEGLAQPFCMCVDDAGLLREKLEFNLIGSILYGTVVHGHPIVGTVVLMKEVGDGENRHLAGLSPEEARAVRNVAEFIIKTVNARKR